MTDPTTPQHDQPVEGSRSESYTRPDDGNIGGSNGTSDADTGTGAAAKASDVIESIRVAVEDFAEKATPVVRQFSVKAADAVATAADKAVPLAHKAGDAAADASGKLAEKSRAWAAGTRASMGDYPTDTFDTTKTTDTTEPPTHRSARPPRRRRPYTPRHDRPTDRPAGRSAPAPEGMPVDSFGKYLHELLDDLAHTMRDAPGVGLAAPQLGEAVQACVIEVEDTLHELVNPRIVRSTGDDRDLEGCLSIPGYVAYVTRREKVWVVAQNRHGKKIKVAGSGLLGRALQHELDHLDGKLYIDYLDSMDELMPVDGSNEDDAEVREATGALA